MYFVTIPWVVKLRLRISTISIGLLWLVAAIVMNIFLSPSTYAVQTVPYKINFQGRLTNASGNTMPDGLYNMKIRMFNSLSGGTSLNEELRESGYRVQVTNGLFSIQIGDNSSLSPSVFTSYPLYIEVELPTPATANCSTPGCGTWTEGAMTPRSPLGSAPYAFNADTVDGIDGADIARISQPNVFSVGSTNTYNGDVQVNKQATFSTSAPILFNAYYDGGGIYTMQNNGSSAFLFNDTSGLRIGASPVNSTGAPIYDSSDILTIKASNQVVKGAIDSGVTYGENQISNPGFEFDCTGWTTCVPGSGSPRSGQKSSMYIQSSSTASHSTQSRYVAVQPGDTMYAQGYLKTTAATTGTGGYFISFYDGVSSTALSTVASVAINPGTSYTLRNVSAIVPAGAVYATVGLANNGDGTTAGTWYFDDVYGENITRLSPSVFKNTVNSTTAFLIQDASASPVFMVDTTNNAIKIGGADVNPNATPTLLIVDHKSTAGDPVGTNGAIYYNANASKFRCYEGGSWKDCITATTQSNLRSKYVASVDFVNGNNLPAEFGTQGSSTGSPGISTLINEPGRVGEVLLSMGNTASSGIAIGAGAYGGRTASSEVMHLGNSQTWTMETAVQPSTLSNATNRYTVRLGFIDQFNTESTDGCFFKYADNISANWLGVCRNNGSEVLTTASSCNLPAVTVGVYANLKLAVNSAGTTAVFVVNDVSTCTITAAGAIPTASARSTSFGAYVQRSNGTSSGQGLYIDYFEVRGDNLPR